MIHTYTVTGMTCEHCQAKVQKLLSEIEGVENATVNWKLGEATITMTKHIETSRLQNALKETNYRIIAKNEDMSSSAGEEQRSWIQTYKPVLLIFGFITGISFLTQIKADSFSWMTWMRHFMAGFFLAFSFFKLLNLSGFADSYSMYDVIAKRWKGYGYVYAFIELILGIVFLSGFQMLLTNSITLVIMSISLVGVLQSVLNKRKIRCACLGDVFNLPMSTITIIEDALMILMSLSMIIYLIR